MLRTNLLNENWYAPVAHQAACWMPTRGSHVHKINSHTCTLNCTRNLSSSGNKMSNHHQLEYDKSIEQSMWKKKSLSWTSLLNDNWKHTIRRSATNYKMSYENNTTTQLHNYTTTHMHNSMLRRSTTTQPHNVIHANHRIHHNYTLWYMPTIDSKYELIQTNKHSQHNMRSHPHTPAIGNHFSQRHNTRTNTELMALRKSANSNMWEARSTTQKNPKSPARTPRKLTVSSANHIW